MASRDTNIGRLQAPRAEAFSLKPIPPGGRRVFILTAAQNNTGIHEKAWANLKALAEHEKARILVGAFTYNMNMEASKHAKRKTAKERGAEREEWWHPAIEPYIFDFSSELAPGLRWCGELQILPTAVNPISGFESYTGRESAILPHAKFALKCVPSPKHRGTKFIYTTGAITLRNYIQKKAGQKAEFHHGYGGLIVEVNDAGTWFVRQLNADSDGVIYDLDRKVDNGIVTEGHRPEAIVWGDIHVDQLEPDMRELGWGNSGLEAYSILDTLRPKRQVFHDLLDFRRQNHHDRDDSWKVFAKAADRGLNVATEVAEAAAFLNEAQRPWCESVVVCSNHDMAFERWLKEVDFREDPLNARLILQATLAAYDAVLQGREDFYSVEWVFRHVGGEDVPARFLRRDEEYLVCKDHGGGVELGMHGDKGVAGKPLTLRGYAKTGHKAIIGHSHTAGIDEGAMQVGVMGSLDQGYNEGLSSWSHTNGLVYPNGKRALFTIYKNSWRA